MSSELMEWSIPMTNKTLRYLFATSVIAILPVLANAAGTYYVGNYQSPQQNYSQLGYSSQRYNGPYRAGQNGNYSQDTTYTRTRMRVTPNDNAYVGRQYAEYTSEVKTEKEMVGQSSSGNGFWIAPSLSHEFASWRFDMKNAGSVLHYDNLRWNVFDVAAGYRFNAGKLPLQIDAGFKYGMQFGDSTMVDDDISNGGYPVTEWIVDWNDGNGNGVVDEGDSYKTLGNQYGHALSVGTSNGGDMFGFNAGFGLTDFFKIGSVRMTPSIGYRYMKYKLETKDTKGLTVDTGACAYANGTDEIQCDPIVIVQVPTSAENPGGQKVLWNQMLTSEGFQSLAAPANSYDPSYYNNTEVSAIGVSTEGTYMYSLPGVSHSYEAEWAGPYLALDMNYDINANNAVNARIEFGLPLYDSVGDQPYRPDWAHSKSVEDKGGFGDAWHFGFGANYMTAITNSLSFTMGVTFDYYSVNGADASTYLNRSYYEDAYNKLLQVWGGDEFGMLYGRLQSGNAAYTYSDAAGGWVSNATSADPLEDAPSPAAQNIVATEKECPGWVCKSDNEIESIYKSLGVRIGLNARF